MILSALALFVASGAQKPTETAVIDGRWEPIPLVTKEFADSGRIGGEGGQWPRSLAVDSTGNRVLAGIDVGGIFRSEDSGKRWVPSNTGYWARGAAALSFDPRNPNRVLAIAGNTLPQDYHGVWLSNDGGKSWAAKLKVNISGIAEFREQLAWDSTSYDSNAKMTKRALWSRVKGDVASWGTPTEHPAIYRTEDGGETWTEIPGSAPFAGGIIRAFGTSAFTANPDGLFKSTNFGTTWTKVKAGTFTGMDVNPTNGWIWATEPKGVTRSKDGGATWQSLASPAADGHILRNIKVSPADANHMVLWRDQDPNQWDWRRYFSKDGGASWQQSTISASEAFLPVNSRQGIFAWHPNDKNVIFSIGGDIITRSDDGGATYKWSNAGNNGVLIGGRWSFSLQDPSVMFFGSQDYNGAVTKDSGRTWTYTNASGNGWGGFTYGGYAHSRNILVVGNSDSWGGKRMLKISRDGGATWKDLGIELSGLESSYGDPRNPKTIFAYNQRSEDEGLTWKPMAGCRGVLTHDKNGTLYGADGKNLVKSTDGGKTWTVISTAAGDIQDIAVDPKRDRIYVVCNDEAAVYAKGTWSWLPIPGNQWGGFNVRTVCVDPKRPERVYVGSAGNVVQTTAALVASMDAGATWTNLTLQKPPTGNQLDGGREAYCARVHPRTGDVWVSTSCFGIWRYVRLAR